MNGDLILVTGATGIIGREVVPALLAAGCRVRALTSRPPPADTPGVEWRRMDWRESLDFDRPVEGCAGVVHLAVEKHDPNLMPRLNVDATRALAAAVDRAGIRLLCFTSSVSVYGSPLLRRVDESAAVLTPDRDVAQEFWAEPFLRAYARSKVAAERWLREDAPLCRKVILRPTVVRDRASILALGDWSLPRRLLLAGRQSHTVAAADVARVIVWFVRDALERGNVAAGAEIYNVGDDETAGTYADFFRRAWQLTRDTRYRCPPPAPAGVDRLMNWCKYRTLAPRWPLGLVQFPSAKLFQTGYRHQLGAQAAYRRALQVHP